MCSIRVRSAAHAVANGLIRWFDPVGLVPRLEQCLGERLEFVQGLGYERFHLLVCRCRPVADRRLEIELSDPPYAAREHFLEVAGLRMLRRRKLPFLLASSFALLLHGRPYPRDTDGPKASMGHSDIFALAGELTGEPKAC